jgi:vitamin B12/bleomycin/antimicrobial peptide transport system ATP-binding/permease protein
MGTGVRSAVADHYVARFVRLALGFWSGPTRAKAWLLTIGVLAGLVLNIAVAVAVNNWSKFFFDALQNDNRRIIPVALGIVVLIAAASVCSSVTLLQVRMRLQLHWREWLTGKLIRRMMTWRGLARNLPAGAIDNPEARIAEDGRLAIELFVDFAAGVTNALLSALSFVSILWFVGGAITMFGVTIPGYLVIAAILYSGLTSYGTLLLGRPLFARVEEKAAREADFRYALIHTRQDAKDGRQSDRSDVESEILRSAFDRVKEQWFGVIGGQTRLLFLSSANGVLAGVVPLVLAAPKFLSGDMSLGDLMQAALAFSQVHSALNWLADNSLRLADWVASAHRVGALDAAFDDLNKDDLLPGRGRDPG